MESAGDEYGVVLERRNVGRTVKYIIDESATGARRAEIRECLECLTSLLRGHLLGQCGPADADRVGPLRSLLGPLQELLARPLDVADAKP